jgi:hypothetical protein
VYVSEGPAEILSTTQCNLNGFCVFTQQSSSTTTFVSLIFHSCRDNLGRVSTIWRAFQQFGGVLKIWHAFQTFGARFNNLGLV